MALEDDVKLGYYDGVVELFELDLRDLEAVDGASQERYYFTNQVLPDGSKIKWRRNDNASSTSTVTYEPLPIAATNFERTTKGQIPTPELTVSNIFGAWSELVEDLDDLIGARIVRRRTLFKHLVGQSSENLNSYFPSDIFYIERKIREDNVSITFQLASPLDLEGLQLPKRIITQNYCVWKYKGTECGYNGPPVADAFNNELKDTTDSFDNAYNDALKVRRRALRALNIAKADLATKRTAKDNACSASAASVETQGGFVESDRDKMYFALPNYTNGQEGNETIMIVWEGNIVTNQDGTGYRQDSKRMTTPYDSYGTGPLYAVQKWEEYLPGLYIQLDEKVNVSSKASATFALNPNEQSSYGFEFFAIWEGQEVTLTTDGEYRLGAQTTTEIHPVYQVDRLDASACATATAEFNAAQAVKDAASATFIAAMDAAQAAADALSSASDLYNQDICGKQVSSCKLRFEGGDLPFGGFPGANLSR
jgi:lambda family phage minor tail protein L